MSKISSWNGTVPDVVRSHHARMGLPFIEDKVAALREMRRVLAPGGRVVLNTPGRIQPPFEIMDEALVRHISVDLARFVRVVFSMDDPDEVGQLVHAAGFHNVDTKSTVTTLHLPPPEEFLSQYINLTPMGGFVNPAPAEAKAALEQELVDRWQEFIDNDDSVPVEQPIVLAVGRT